MLLASPAGERIAIAINGDRRATVFAVPARPGFRWRAAAGTERDIGRHLDDGALLIAGRSVVYLSEEADQETPS
jgi:glycogen operon protein